MIAITEVAQRMPSRKPAALHVTYLQHMLQAQCPEISGISLASVQSLASLRQTSHVLSSNRHCAHALHGSSREFAPLQSHPDCGSVHTVPNALLAAVKFAISACFSVTLAAFLTLRFSMAWLHAFVPPSTADGT